MILTDQQRDALITEISGAIRNNDFIQCDTVIKEFLKVPEHSELFYICWHEYNNQRDTYKGHHPFYIEDERGTFGFMRLRDDDGRILGYETKENKEYTDINYKPSPADKRKIAGLIESGTPVYYYIGYYLAVSLGNILDEYTEPAVYEFERKRHRRFDLTDPNPNNSALYIALYDSYFSQYKRYMDITALKAGLNYDFYCYDFPTLTAETETRKNYYARLIQRATKGEITLKQIWRFPHGKGIAPKSRNFVRETIMGNVGGYNCDAILHGRDFVPRDESEIELERIPQGLLYHAIR